MSLEQLWAGWRLNYVQEASAAERATGDSGKARGSDCVFCRIAASGKPSPDNGIVWRDALSLAVLNAFPYASGHLLVMPVRHVAALEELTEEESASLWTSTLAAISAISSAYDPDGLNVGANLGRAAGAGIPEHVHLHALPRWNGDTNFMTSVAGVRVMPEALTDSWRRLSEGWPKP
jgi:ATP adenylyltransferase